ncbi:hypothetical protein Pint_06048 [Pistacia integerrima]|uniref:Uncharacterized protein n=1 Tax=Pistacia integerrima TaxID=434235 RepID=A0ACC0Z5D2_9ROSI|nr:hypothetical protein Pint_06048 [Pistacia integerrima]
MHLWPTVRIRESFKISYLRKLEWNLNRMDSEKKRRSQDQPLLLDDNQTNAQVSETPRSKNSPSGFASICKEILMVASCCFCCFCCGGLPLIKKSAKTVLSRANPPTSMICTYDRIVKSVVKVKGNRFMFLYVIHMMVIVSVSILEIEHKLLFHP